MCRGVVRFRPGCGGQTRISLSRTPATKAPRAAESPAALVSAAVVKEIATNERMNISRDPSCVTRRRSHVRARPPSRAMPPSTAAALSRPIRSSVKKPPPSPLSAGRTAIMGMKARSCTRSMPVRMRPWRLSRSPRSLSVFRTTIVLLSETARASVTVLAVSRPSRRPTPYPMEPINPICARVPKTAMLRSFTTSRKDTSTPTAKSSRITPNSARDSTVA